ncbi:CC chemokine-like protein [Mudlarkpox virus]|nr:CC chemokine-like protein [Cheloniid poxvirus 1]QRM15511.1 CC chemokine-like protein [Mudlarkpox virus]
MNYKLDTILIVLICLCSYISCPRPKCDKVCCDNGRAYNARTRDRDLCRLKCYLCFLLSMVQNSGSDSSLVTSLCNGTINDTKDLDECLQKCGDSPPRGCDKKCCDQRDMVVQNRRGDPEGCCNGHRRVGVEDVKEEDVVDCRRSSDSCSDQGFLILYSDNSTVCVSSGSKSDGELGYQFGYSDECWQLAEDLSDPRKKYWQELE